MGREHPTRMLLSPQESRRTSVAGSENVSVHLAGQLMNRLGEISVPLEKRLAKLRVLVVLKDVYGLSHEEIADELGISVPAAKVRLHRGRKKLRDLLYEDADDGRHEHAV